MSYAMRYVVADTVGQLIEGGEFSLERLSIFGLFGFVIGGTVMHTWLYSYYGALFGRGILNRYQISAMVIMDVFFNMPVLHMP